jgi:hypothetical protein
LYGSRWLPAEKLLPGVRIHGSRQSASKQRIAGVAVTSNLAIKNFGITERLVLLIVMALLTTIFWGNVLRFSPRIVDRTYDTTSDGVVIGRMARSAVDGFTSGNADLGVNVEPTGPTGGKSFSTIR